MNTSSSSANGADGATFRVLVIDDDETITALAHISLGKHGFAVESANSGGAGLNLLERVAPDVVVCDVVMPDLLGWEVLRRIREVSRVPVLMLSGRASDVDKVRGLDLGADDYLSKPFTLSEFEARVSALLRRTRWSFQRPSLAVCSVSTDDRCRH